MPGSNLLSQVRARPGTVMAAAWVLVATYRYLIWRLYMQYIPLTGDEQYYHRGASILHRWLRGVAENETVVERIVAKGWFMPGTIFHLLPARRLTGDIGLLRLWQGTLDLLLLTIATALVARLFGKWIGIGFLLFLGLMPDTATQSFTLWGEAHGSKVLLIGLLLVVVVVRNVATWGDRRLLAATAGIGLVIGWSIYLRPPFILQIGAAAVSLVILVAGRIERPRLGSAVGAAALVPVMAIALIVPWSIQVSRESGGFVLTTNSINVNLIHAFSDPDELVAKVGGDDFGTIEAYLRNRMRETGETYVEALGNTRSELLANVSISEYYERADREVTSYLDEEESFLGRYQQTLSADANGVPRARYLSGFRYLHWLNVAMWYPLAVVSLYAFARPFALSVGHGFLGVISKIAVPAAIVQPWVSNAKFRHLGAIIPLLVLVALLALVERGRAPIEADRATYRPWALRLGEAVYVISALAVLLTVIVFVT